MTVPVRVGEIIAGRYRVERVLGQGGMGVVVAARHVHLDEPVAIKFPLPRAMLRTDLVARAVREGRAAARLKGEHVARVIDVGTLDTGEPYIVLELLRGSDLAAVLDAKGALPIDEALEYVLQACEALAEAHALGIVHRDLKPANLFLTRRPDGSRSIKIIDFGIAKAAQADAADAPVATESHALLGTPLYMSPEQMRSSRDVDARSDVWSLGAVLHHLLAGKPPFPPLSLPEIYQLALEGAPPVRAQRPEVPEAVDAALRRCLAKDRADRFADVAELACALAPHAPERARLSAERARRILASGAAEGSVDSGELAARGGPRADEPMPETLGVAATKASADRANDAEGDARADGAPHAAPDAAGLAPTLAAVAVGSRPSRQGAADLSPRPALSAVAPSDRPPQGARDEAESAPKRTRLVLAVAVTIATGLITMWLLGRGGPDATPTTGSAAVSPAITPSASPARAPVPAVVAGPEPTAASSAAPAIVTPDAPVLTTTTALAATATPTASTAVKPATPSSASARPRGTAAPTARPGLAPAGAPGPLDDPD